MATTLPTPVLHERGTPGYKRLGAAMWCAGLATFVLVYCVQGLLPTLAGEFAVSSSTSSLVLSATTARSRWRSCRCRPSRSRGGDAG